MNIGDKMFKGLAWSFIERISIQAIQFFIQIALARILTPAEYGTMGILYVFLAISMVFIDSGFTKALIQKKDRTSDDISTVFLFNIGISLIAYILLFFIAPVVAEFYHTEQLTLLLRVLSLSLVINALFAVPMTLYSIELDFKTITKINFLASIISGAIAYYMAWAGYGVWALVGLTISRSITAALSTWVMDRWKPNWNFSKKSFKELFAFGSNLLISSLLNVAVNKVYDLIIPKANSIEDYGYYTRGTQFTDFIFSMLNSIFERVLLPGLTELQDKTDILVKHTRSIIKATTMLIVPVFILLALIAEPLIHTLLTDKWLPAVPIMQIFCFARLISIVSGINVNILYVLGRTDLALKQQYLKLIIRVVFLLIALQYGIIFIALAELLSTICHFFINTYHPGKIMSYGAFKQLKDLRFVLLAGLLMSITVYYTTYNIENNFLNITASILVGLPIYLTLIHLFKIKELYILTDKLKGLLNK